MTKRLVVLVSVTVVACAQQPAGENPDVRAEDAEPVFEVALWPGEGIPVVEAVGPRLLLRAAPAPTAAVVDSLILGESRGLAFDSTRYQTLMPARLTVAAPTVLAGRFFGRLRYLSREEYYRGAHPDTSIRLARGDTLSYLQYRAEGTCFVSVDGAVIDAGICPVADTVSIRASGQPLTSWWILVNMDGHRGWVIVSDSTARVIDRRF